MTILAISRPLISGPTPGTALIVDIKRFQAEVAHPFRLILLFGNLLDDVRCQASIGLIGILEVIPEVIHVSEIVDGIEIFFSSSNPVLFSSDIMLTYLSVLIGVVAVFLDLTDEGKHHRS